MKNSFFLEKFISEIRKEYQRDLLSGWIHWQIGPYQSAPWLLDTMIVPESGLTLEDCDVLLEHSRPYRQNSYLNNQMWWWILKAGKTVPPDRQDAFHHGLYLRVIDWVAAETHPDIVGLLANNFIPPALSPAEKTKSVQVWREKLAEADNLQRENVKIPLLHQLYRLTDDPDEKFFTVREGIRNWRPNVRSAWIMNYCRQHPAELSRLRQDCMNDVLKARSSAQFMNGWRWLILIGAGEFEPQLMEILQPWFQTGFRSGESQSGTEKAGSEASDFKIEWFAISHWCPENPVIRAKLLDGWRTLDMNANRDIFNTSPVSFSNPESHPAFRFRQLAIFTLEEDESRLVTLIAEQGEKGHRLTIPHGWCPRHPQLQQKLAEVVPVLLEKWIRDPRLKSFPGKLLADNQNDLWGLLFQLPVPGERIISLIQTALSEGVPDSILSRIHREIQSSGLPADTPVAPIKASVETITAHLQRLPLMDKPTSRVEPYYRLALELVRESVRHETTSSEGIDRQWVSKILPDICQSDCAIMLPDVALHVVETWGDTRPPGFAAVMAGLWSLGVTTLEKHISAYPSTQDDISAVRWSLGGLIHLFRYATFPSPHPSADHPADSSSTRETFLLPAESSASLMKTLSILAPQESHPFIFLIAARLGNYLTHHQKPSRLTDWWTAMCDQPRDLVLDPLSSEISFSTNLSHLVRHEFLVNHLSTILQANSPVDATGLLRILRSVTHHFPDSPTTPKQIWPDIFDRAKKQWEMENGE